MPSAGFVFAYGSLAGAGAGEVRRLPGKRRVLGVAMDNAVDLPGYKWWRDPRDGSRPAVMVAFADLTDAPAAAPPVNGLCLPVPREAWPALDARERNYVRAEITDRLEDPPGRVWTYLGSPAGRARLARGVAEGRAVVARSYVEAVQTAFRVLGPAEHRAFVASTDFAGVPVLALDRIDAATPITPTRSGRSARRASRPGPG